MPTSRYSTVEMIERLIAFDTTSAKSNLDFIDFVEAYLAEHGIAGRRTSESDGKANLLASIGPAVPGGIVLSGHSDVVPVTGQTWSSDPFTVAQRGDRLYGRGTSDMKSFIAIALALVPEMQAAGLARPIHLAFSYDEEVGCTGVGPMINLIARELPRPAAVVIGEPTSMQLVTAHKGIAVFETAIRGQAAHSSQPHRGGNAIAAAAEVIAFIGSLAAARREASAGNSRFEPPYTTFNIGLIEGGNAVNIIAADCRFQWEFRVLPQDDPAAIEAEVRAHVDAEILPALREFAPEASIDTRKVAEVPALRPEEGGPAEALVRQLTGANQTLAVAFATEGGHFQDAGLSTVVCGPGSIDQAHQPDEFIELVQVKKCESFLRDLTAWCCRPLP
ncbi:MAG TPA: acetylornithine deacetylase [Kiloniellaceae bacterium]|nr:acetylornithine deacetylase [Kiloniellaceae bacterium]